MNKRKNIYFYILIIIAFLVSIIIRLPNLNRPLSKHHEYNLAHILVCYESWEANGGAAKFNYSPINFYNKKGDSIYKEDYRYKNGYYHYLSYPPGQFVLPYIISQITGIQHSVLSMQIFNLIINILVVFQFFLLLGKMFKEDKLKQTLITILFIFTPAVMWYFGNSYVHESFVLLFVLIFFNCSINILFLNKYNKQNVLLLVCSVSLGIYTDWLMLVLPTASIIYCFIMKSIANNKYIFINIFTIAATLLFIYLQFGSYFGYNNYLYLIKQTFLYRGGVNKEWAYILFFIKRIFLYFAISFFPVIVVLVYFLIKYKDHFILYNLNDRSKFILYFFIPIFFYFVLLHGFSIEHDYSVLKFTFFLFFIGYLLTPAGLLAYPKIIVGLYFLFSVAIYYYINRPGLKNYKGDYYDREFKLGNFIKKNVTDVQTIFMNLDAYNQLAVSYYAKRIIIPVTDTIHIVDLHKYHDPVFIMDSFGIFKKVSLK